MSQSGRSCGVGRFYRTTKLLLGHTKFRVISIYSDQFSCHGFVIQKGGDSLLFTLFVDTGFLLQLASICVAGRLLGVDRAVYLSF